MKPMGMSRERDEEISSPLMDSFGVAVDRAWREGLN
jgi:hypothetical protein